MEIGLISDVHANLPALEAVLEDMPDVDEILCLGDVVGYNPYPRQALEQVQEYSDYVIQGNHDRIISNPVYANNKAAIEGLKLAKEELGNTQIQYLKQLPEKTELHDGQFLAVHSHPEYTDQYVMPGSFDDVEQYLDGYDAIFLGHTHVQKKKQFDNGLIVNPGSVGQPRDESSAAYAVFDTETLETELHRTNYSIYEVVQKIDSKGLPKKTADKLTPNSQANQRRNNARNNSFGTQ